MSFIALTEDSDSTQVTIDTDGQAVGSYELVMESFDISGGVYSALKTDIVTIKIAEPVIEIVELEIDDSYKIPIVQSLTIDPPVAILPVSVSLFCNYNDQQRVTLKFANPLVQPSESTS